MSENQDELKVQIKAWLKQQNISRNDFAAECFVSPNTVRNWLAKVAIPKDKEALIRLMMEKTEREKKLKEAARANWKPFVVMLSSEDYKLIEEAARRDNMTVEEWAEATLIKDAQKRMKNYYDDSSLPEDVSLAAEVPEEYGAPRCNVTAKMAKIDRKMANSLLTASSQHRHCNAVASPLQAASRSPQSTASSSSLETSSGIILSLASASRCITLARSLAGWVSSRGLPVVTTANREA